MHACTHSSGGAAAAAAASQRASMEEAALTALLRVGVSLLFYVQAYVFASVECC